MLISFTKENKAGEGDEECGVWWGAMWNGASEGITEKVPFEMRPEIGQRGAKWMSGEEQAGRFKCKGSGAAVGLVCLRNIQEPHVARTEWIEVARMMRARSCRALLDHCEGFGFDSEWMESQSHWKVLHRAVTWNGLGFQRIPLAAGLPVGYSRAAGSSETREEAMAMTRRGKKASVGW